MTNRFLEKIAWMDGLSPTAEGTRSGSLARATSHRINSPAAFRERFGFATPFSATDRALVVLMENGGLDLGIGRLVDFLLSALPGSSFIPRSYRDQLVEYIDRAIRELTDDALENIEMMINDYAAAAPDPYGNVTILRNGTALYDSLKDKLIELSEAGKTIDLFVLTHGSDDYIALEGSDHITGDRLRQIRTIHNGGAPVRLRAVYMMNCVGNSLNQAWLDIGAKVSSGALGLSIPEPMMYYFFRNWKSGQSFSNAVENAYSSMIDFFESILTTGIRVVFPTIGAIPGFDSLIEKLADLENWDIIANSAPVIAGERTVTIASDDLSFSQSVRARSFACVALPQQIRGSAGLPRAMQIPGRIMSHTISDAGIEFIKSFEGFREHLYNDPAGHCTIGYGHLVHRENCDGRPAEHEFQNGITEARAMDLMRQKLTEFERVVNDRVTVRLTPHQFDALVSFVYNIGRGNFTSSNCTLLRRLNNGEYDAVPAELARWNKADGEVLPGLTRRRAAEGRMFANGDYSTGQSLVSFFEVDVPDSPDVGIPGEGEGDERPDGGYVASAMQAGLSGHCQLITPADTAGTAHFSLQEFNSKDGASTPRGAIGNIQIVMEQLEILRDELGGNAITVVSGYRSPAHNTSVGGVAHSQHMCGTAADIRVANHSPAEVFYAIERLMVAGRMRHGGLGCYDSFVHYDIRGTIIPFRRPPGSTAQNFGLHG